MQDAIHNQYLEAMGIDTYAARYPLPGAAPSRVLVALPESVLDAPEQPPQPPLESLREAPVEIPEVRPPPGVLVERREPSTDSQPPAPVGRQATEAAVHFTLAVVFTERIAWIEALEKGHPLAREQVQLVLAMTRAIRGAAGTPKTAQFDWPMHNNRQLDCGLNAARDAFSAFIGRHINELGCESVVLLGDTCAQYVNLEQLQQVRTLKTCSTLQLLAEPGLKRQAWQNLRKLSGRV